MFKKLIKYELKDCMRVFLPLWGAVVVLAGINGFTLRQNEPIASPLLQFLVNMLPMLLFVGLSFAMFIVAFALIIRRFYSGLLGEGGYLAFTLPVTHAQHIGSKLLAALIMGIGCTVVGLLASSLIVALQSDGFRKMLHDMTSFLGQLFAEYPSSPLFILETILMVLLYASFLVLRLYSGMAVGHLFGNHRAAWSVAAVIAIGWIVNLSVGAAIRLSGMIEKISSDTYSFDSLDRFFQTMPKLFGAVIVFLAVWNIILWFVTEWILKKKLNIL